MMLKKFVNMIVRGFNTPLIAFFIAKMSNQGASSAGKIADNARLTESIQDQFALVSSVADLGTILISAHDALSNVNSWRAINSRKPQAIVALIFLLVLAINTLSLITRFGNKEIIEGSDEVGPGQAVMD